MENTLVSVVIITFNSKEHVLEALESVKAQTYKNIELIISDDGSTDETVEIIKNWLLDNNERFSNYKFILSDKNTGITANLNRGVRATSGEYIKLMASDDLLMENCVEDLLKFVKKNNLLFCFSRVMPFSVTMGKKQLDNIISDEKSNFDYFFNKTQKGQYHALLLSTTPKSTIIGAFYSKSMFELIGFFDENYEMMEDYPLAINLSKKGYRFDLLDKYTSRYRIRDIQNDKENETFKKSRRFIAHYNNLRNFRNNEIIPLMKAEKMYFSIIYLRIIMLLLHIEYKNENKIYLFLMRKLRAIKNLLMKVT